MIFLLASRKLYDKPELIERFWPRIEAFLQEHIEPNEPILMGNFLTGPLRERLQSEGYMLKIQPQARHSLANHNKKLIRENDPILLIRVDGSSGMGEFAAYAKERGKSVYMLELDSDESAESMDDGNLKRENHAMNKNEELDSVGKFSIHEFLQKPLFIPEYQRPYAWSREQVEALLDDLYEAFEKEQKKYLVGNMILHKNDKEEKYNIVDGQQRCVTFYLIFRALVKNKGLLNGVELSVLSAKALNENRKHIENFLSKLGEMEKRSFHEYLEKNVVVTYTVADTLDEAFFYFDSQNTRGKALARKDLLKVHHFRYLPHDDRLRRKIITTWEAMEFDGEGENRKDRIEELLKSYLGIARKAVRGELSGNDLKHLDVFKEFEARGQSQKLNRYNQPPLFESFDYDIFENRLQLVTRPARFMGPYQLADGDCYLPFEITQSIDGGKNFFYYLFKYMCLKEMLDKIPAFTMLDSATGTGNGYLNTVYKSALMFYYDKFGGEEMEEFAYLLYFMMAYMRIKRFNVDTSRSGRLDDRGVVKFQWDENNLFDPFRQIYLTYDHSHLCGAMRRYGKFNFSDDELKKTSNLKGAAKEFVWAQGIDREKAKAYYAKISKSVTWEEKKND